MIIDENSNNSSTFSIFTNKELEQQNYIKQIDFILEKYNILENDNQLIGSIEKNILFTINYIEHLLIKKESIPYDLENLFLNNYTFKEQINIFVEKKLLNLTKNDSIYFFKDLNIMLHLLSVGTNEKIIESYNNYNLDSLSNLFRFYETKLKSLFPNDEKLFNLTFGSYIILLRTITQLCSFNSIDIIAKKNIKYFIELMTETINILKFNIMIEEEKIQKLNNIQGICLKNSKDILLLHKGRKKQEHTACQNLTYHAKPDHICLMILIQILSCYTAHAPAGCGTYN